MIVNDPWILNQEDVKGLVDSLLQPCELNDIES